MITVELQMPSALTSIDWKKMSALLKFTSTGMVVGGADGIASLDRNKLTVGNVTGVSS